MDNPNYWEASCEVLPVDIINQPTDKHNGLSTIEYMIDFKVTIREKQARQLDGNIEYEETCFTENENKVQLDLLTYGDESRNAIAHTLLHHLQVPEEICEPIVDEIVKQVVYQTWSKQLFQFERKFLCMVAYINVSVVYDIQDDVFDELQIQFVRASKSSIEKLEKVRVEQEVLTITSMSCSICMEEIVAGSEATRMPCSHPYHEDCIVKWLEQSRFCPLCRFPMPTHDSHTHLINDDMPSHFDPMTYDIKQY